MFVFTWIYNLFSFKSNTFFFVTLELKFHTLKKSVNIWIETLIDYKISIISSKVIKLYSLNKINKILFTDVTNIKKVF